ncbi:MAG: hypothetical protein K2P81_16350 [Bacteriovoracaceae bacterium]|nr:hypothetical protein [Bacteriovoracaceae bacterium]
MGKREKIIFYYDKFPFVKYVPVFGPFLDNIKKMDKDPVALKKVDEMVERILFIKNFHRTAPRKYTGGIVLNFLGLHPFLVTFHHITWKIRSMAYRGIKLSERPIVDELNINGVIIIPDFYTPEEIAALRRDFQTKSPFFIRHFPEFKEGLILGTNAVKPWT